LNEFIEGSGPRSKRGADPTPKGWYYYNTGATRCITDVATTSFPRTPKG